MPDQPDSLAPPLLVAVADVRQIDPSWPWTADMTYRLIKSGRLSCVRVGRRVFLRREDLQAFVRNHVTGVRSAGVTG